MTFKEFLFTYRIPTKVVIMDEDGFTILRSQAEYVPKILAMDVSHVELSLTGDEAVVYLRCVEGGKAA